MKTATTLIEGIREAKIAAASMNGDGRGHMETHARSIAPNVAILDPFEQMEIEAELRDAGCSATFIRTYMSAIRKMGREYEKKAEKKKAEVLALESGPADDRPQSEKIEGELTKWGWTFRTNTLEDLVEVNGEALTDGVMAVIHTKARDEGYGERFSGKPSIAALDDCVRAIAQANPYNPLQDWFNALPKWDGKPHFEDLCSYVVSKQELPREGDKPRFVFDAFLWRAMLGVVAKTFYTPMCQPPMMVLAGPQNIGKSTYVQRLAPGGPRFFVSQAIHPDQKDQQRQLMRIAMWEVGELGATTRRSDVESLKHFLTLQTVTVRHPYDKYDTTKPAITVFFGTVNPDGGGFLNDVTGDRRFAVVEVEDIDHAYSDKIDMEQVWAQVYAHWQQNPDSWRYTEEEWEVRGNNNKKHRKVPRYVSDIPRLFQLDPTKIEKGDRDWWMSPGMIRDWLEKNRVKCSTDADEKNLRAALQYLGVAEQQRSLNNTTTRGFQGIQPLDMSKTDTPVIDGDKDEDES